MSHRIFLFTVVFSILAIFAFSIFKKRDEPVVKVPHVQEIKDQIRALNLKNRSISSVSCNISTFASNTEVRYTRPSCFESTTKSLAGAKVAEVASDGVDYWFWLKNFDRNSVYHCPVSDVPSTRLAVAMRPKVIISALGVDDSIRGEVLIKEDGSAEVTATEDDLVKKTTIKEGRISEIVYIKDESIVGRINFKSYQQVDGHTIPRTVVLEWDERGAKIITEIADVRINSVKSMIPKIPDNLRKVSLVDY